MDKLLPRRPPKSPILEQTGTESRASYETNGITVELGGRRSRGSRDFNSMNEFRRRGISHM